MLTDRQLLRECVRWMAALVVLCSVTCEAGVLTAAQARYPIAGADIAMLKDPSGRLTVEALDQPALARQFTQLDAPPVLGYAKEVIWLRLRLQRQEDAAQTWFLELSNPFINDLRLYARSGAGFEVAQAGDQFAFAQRALKFRYPVFALAFPDTQEQTFYLRMQSDSSLAGSLVLWQPDALREKAQHETFYFSAVLGMLCMSFLISMLHGLHGREPKVLLFAALTLTVFLQVAVGLGLLAEFLMPAWPMLADLLVPWSLALSTLCVGLVFGRALNIAADFPRLLRFIRLASILALAAPLSRYIDQYNSWGGPLLQLLSLLVFCSTGWVSWWRWRARTEGAAYFFVAHAILIGSMVMGRLIYLGWLPANLFNQLTWVPGLLFYIFLVHAGIFVDSQSVKRERNAALAEIQTAQLVLASERAMREEQGIFFAFVAHELRSPLAAILTGLKNLENECTDMQQALLQRARRIKTYAERMSRVIDRHLSLQRLASAEFAPEFAPIDPRHIAEESLGRVQALFTDRVFVADYAADLPTGISGILGDADLLHMALDNLLTNAAKYSPEKTDIAFDVWVDAALHFRVSDRGPGVAAGQVSRMFSVFNRLQQPGFTGGFGIGLAIARRIAQAHGGNLLYADRAGGGAVFTLSLPLSPVAAEDAA